MKDASIKFKGGPMAGNRYNNIRKNKVPGDVICFEYPNEDYSRRVTAVYLVQRTWTGKLIARYTGDRW